MSAPRPIVVVEDDPFTRIIQVVLDSDSDPERGAAFADFFAHDEPDFAGWCERLRTRAAGLYPAEVRLVSSQEELRRYVGEAHAIVIESLNFGYEEARLSTRLAVVQKYGAILRNIDAQACAKMGIKVLGLRRRANIACAEHALGMMLVLAKKMNWLNGLISVEQLEAVGYPYRPYDRRHTPNSNWPRIPGIRMLHEATLGIIGVGEIGREIVVRAAAFGMRVLYHQRTRMPEAEELDLRIQYAGLDELLSRSDWIVPQVPGSEATRGLIGRRQFARMKPGAVIVNVSRADVVEREALIDALKSGRLGGFGLDPLYEEPGHSDDDLLRFDNVVLTPHTAAQPRFNALQDLEQLINQIAREEYQ